MKPIDKQSKRGVLIRSGLHVARHPARPVSSRVKKRFAKRGLKHRVFDIGIVAILGVVVIGGLYQFVFKADPGKRVEFSAVVAPHEVISGDESTLSISYTNNSSKELADVTLTLQYPPYFVLQDVDDPSFEAQTNTLTIGTLAPGANGLVKIKGVMFGDIGGEQTFSSTLGYKWGESKSGTREQSYSFSPVSSALVINTDLPDRLVSGQRLSGTINLENTGPVTFPEASIHAIFPDGYSLTSTSLSQRNDETWIVPSIEPGESLVIEYAGTLAIETDESANFQFEPSFVFGNERFAQDALHETVTTVPSPISLALEIDGDISSNNIPVNISWSDQTDLAIEDVVISIEGATNAPEWHIDTPVTADSRTATLIPSDSTTTNRTASFRPRAQFSMDGLEESIVILGEPIQEKLPTRVTMGTFARYFTSAGDQLGRGPLPPRVGDETIYWIFLNISNTQNHLAGTTVTATLPANVTWVDRQSVTYGSAVHFDQGTRQVTWNIDELKPTSQTNQRIAASFAVAITPTEAQQGLTPALISNIAFSAQDTWVEQRVSKSFGSVTTKISEDSGIVR